MYYHARPLKYVKYGKVEGNPEPDEDFGVSYRWLSNHCGHFPQVWLSRSHSRITGIRNYKDQILFSFDVIKGFPIHYDWWNYILGWTWQKELSGLDPVRDAARYNEEIWKAAKRFYEPLEEDDREEWLRHMERDLPGDPRNFSSAEEWLMSAVFRKQDQVVVPSLNLKAAKEVFCRSEKEKKKLRKMGFIEDRIKIRKFPNPDSWV